MATKAPVKAPIKAKVRPKTAPPAASELMGDPWAIPPVSTEERLHCIEALGKRILEHVRFMCAVEKLPGTSREAKDQAVMMFYERLRLSEVELNRVQEGLRLG
jgi:hypothetical protein